MVNCFLLRTMCVYTQFILKNQKLNSQYECLMNGPSSQISNSETPRNSNSPDSQIQYGCINISVIVATLFIRMYVCLSNNKAKLHLHLVTLHNLRYDS